MDCWLVKFSNGISDSSQEGESVVGCFQFSVSPAVPPPLFSCGFAFACGCAASRAESLRLSVKAHYSLAATPPEAKPLLFLRSERKARGFPHGRQHSRMTSQSFI